MGIILFAIAILLIAEIVGFIVGVMTSDEDIAGIVGTFVQVLFLVVILVNYTLVPNKDERYVPETAIAASLDGKASLNTREISANTPYYLQIKVVVKSNSLARRLFGNNDIPFTIEVSNPGGSEFSEAQNVQYCVETKPKETDGDKTVYFYTVKAAGKPRTAVMDFTVTPKLAGSQIVKIVYDKKVSGIHTKTVTLEYKN
jgi:hypothetical protein